jgi:hypothetical protein
MKYLGARFKRAPAEEEEIRIVTVGINNKGDQ